MTGNQGTWQEWTTGQLIKKGIARREESKYQHELQARQNLLNTPAYRLRDNGDFWILILERTSRVIARQLATQIKQDTLLQADRDKEGELPERITRGNSPNVFKQVTYQTVPSKQDIEDVTQESICGILAEWQASLQKIAERKAKRKNKVLIQHELQASIQPNPYAVTGREVANWIIVSGLYRWLNIRQKRKREGLLPQDFQHHYHEGEATRKDWTEAVTWSIATAVLLSSREKRIVQQYREGYRQNEIAKMHQVTSRTIRRWNEDIAEKLEELYTQE